MAVRVINVTLGGKRWKLHLNKRDNASGDYGQCHVNDKKLIVFARAFREKLERETLIHECLHALFPFLDEEAVTAAATEMDNVLNRLSL